MSAIADFVLIKKSKLEELRKSAEDIDGYWNFIEANSTPLKDYMWSGYAMFEVIVFLEENKGVDLMDNEYKELVNELSEKRENATLIITMDQRNKYLDQLNALNCSIDELVEFNLENSGSDDREYAQIQITGIAELAGYLSALKDNDQVILLSIG